MATASPCRPPCRPLPLANVRLTGGLLADRQRLNREVLVPTQHRLCKRRIANLRLDWAEGDDREPPHKFWDSDLAKWLEAAAYSLTTHPDPELAAKVEAVVDLLEQAQMPDGYLDSYFQQVAPQERWNCLVADHELYCAGHLMEAAVAHHEATGKRRFLEVVCRLGDHLVERFGPGEGQLRGYPGHPETELALMRLWRETGELRYLELAKFFVDERGTEPNYFTEEAKRLGRSHPSTRHELDYTQAHAPVRQQATAEGHSVRAVYLCSGMVDVAVATGDEQLLAACHRLWRNIVDRRMYVHGGIGSTSCGERFTFDYDLPNETAYAETCAAIGLIFFAHRLLQQAPRAEYADVIERALYNNVLASLSLDGQRYFYSNYLASQPPRHEFDTYLRSPVRQEWFGCACCPPNIARLLASLGRYVVSTAGDALYLHLYSAGTLQADLDSGPVQLRQTTDYPWDGQIEVTVEDTPETPFTLALRLPGWCRHPALAVNGDPLDVAELTTGGYACIRRVWQAGDVVRLHLPMPVEHLAAHPRVRQDRDRVALQRGPLLYCLEEIDNGADLNTIVLPKDANWQATWQAELLGGVVVLEGQGRREAIEAWGSDLYRPVTPPEMHPCPVKAIPYYAWANRGAGEMLVWLR